MTFVRGLFCAERKPVENGAHHLVQGQPAVEVQLGGETYFGVDHAIAGQVDRTLGGDALELISGLH